MKRIIAIVIMSLAVSGLQAQRKFQWNNSEDGESMVYAYLPAAEKATGRAIVDLPGGGYGVVAIHHEGHDWAQFFNDMGIAYFVVKYRMPKGNPPIPQGDVMRAIKTVRDSAALWHVNPDDVGIMGFSAGGHLASTIATHAPMTTRPNFQILFYPVITFGPGTHEGSRDNFLGENKAVVDSLISYSNERQVRAHFAPPALILLSNDDLTVPVLQNGVAYYTAIKQNGGSAALHIYPTGGHGWGYNKGFAYHEDMKQTVSTWLKQLKLPKADAVRVACIGNSITDGHGIAMSDANGYPAQLQQMLGLDYNVLNCGRSARTMLWKGDHPYMNEQAWQDCLDFRPNIAVIKLGTNDSKGYNWKHRADFEGDMQEMIDALKALPSRPRILLCYPAKAWKRSWDINDSIITTEIMPAIDRLTKKNKLSVIDLHSATSTDESLFQQDGIHPNEKGCKVIAEKVCEAIKQ